jgi:diguanylate cyclase (GGDEF)-like protein
MIDGGLRKFGIIWVLIFPLITYFFKGKHSGTILSLTLVLIALMIIFLSYFKLVNSAYKPEMFFDIFVVFILISAMTYYYEDTFTKSEEIIIRQLYVDSLTNLPNRVKMINDIKKIEHIVLILINIDSFKEINDLYGNKVGDKVLIKISKRLNKIKNKTKSIYNIYKLHADEFAIILKNFENKEYVQNFIENVHKILSRDMLINELEISLSMSIGIAQTSKDILADTDMALKLAKEKRKNIIFFDKSMKIVEKYEENLSQLRKLKLAIATDNIVPYAQPIIKNEDNTINKYECLVRLINNKEVISPYYFIDIAKKSKLYHHITRLIILKAFNAFANTDFEFSINLTVDDILNSNTVDFITNSLKDYNISERVVFELVESEKIEEINEVNDFIFNMKKMGCKIAIDDFGSGYSNFAYILRMNIDYLKIDSSLIKNLDNDPNSLIITDTIVNFSKKLNIKTIAEFVHTKSVFEKVKRLGIDYSQGYYFGEPVPVEKITNLHNN